MIPRTSRSLAKRFGAKLKAARRDRGFSQGELAKRAGLDQTAISRLEAGAREPRLSTIVMLAQALGIPTSELLSD
jgi:transcriptional regulator with XRE-family HTH domain